MSREFARTMETITGVCDAPELEGVLRSACLLLANSGRGAILALLVLLALIIAVLSRSSSIRMVRYMLMGDVMAGRAFVGTARSAQKELRSRCPARFPATPHMFTSDMQGNWASMACSVCLMPVLDAQDGLFCMPCGTVAHSQCRRFLKPTCRPLSLPLDTPPTHDWRPAGCTVAHGPGGVSRQRSLPEGGEEEGEEGQAQCCIYCSDPCEVGLISMEPVWVCSGCHCLAHVQCFVSRHPHLFSDTMKAQLQGQLEGLENGPTSSDVDLSTRRDLFAVAGEVVAIGQGVTVLRGGQVVQGDEYCGGGTRGSGGGGGHEGGSGGGGGGKKHLSRKGSGNNIAAGGGTGAQNGGGVGVMSPVGSVGGRVSPRDKGEEKQNGLRHDYGNGHHAGVNGGVHGAGRKGRGASGDGAGAHTVGMTGVGNVCKGLIEGLEVCGLGPTARCVLPPTCVRVVSSSGGLAGGQSRTASGALSTHSSGELVSMLVQKAGFTRRRSSRSRVAGGGGAGLGNGLGGSGSGGLVEGHVPSVDGHHTHQHNDQLPSGSPKADAVGAAGVVPVVRERMGSSSSHKSSWWKRGIPNVQIHRWSGYCLADELPPGTKPILVFINLISGPQLGKSLHCQMLQLLHPLQVVELPKEDPLCALRFFAPAFAHLRILVMGGDGTVGWVLQTLDTLAMELGGSYVQPPVGVLPMGTGNDLARCLGWGASAGARLKGGLPACLLEVVGSGSHPVPLDRWTVTITPPGPTPAGHSQGTGRSRLNRLLSKTRHRMASMGEAAAAPMMHRDQGVVVKTLNNYLGVGIDAQVALQFHQARSAFPFWFQSQLGNKVIYTGLGAPDLITRSCVALHKKVTLQCDGVMVPVPEDAQGLVVINIGSHMGGAFLWEHGLPAPPIPIDSDADPDLRKTATALTANKRNTCADGLIEVVAIGGVTHMGRLAVGLARAQRLAQCAHVVIHTHQVLPMQVDGEPWRQDPSTIQVTFKNQALMIRRVAGGQAQRVLSAVSDALDASLHDGLISAGQKAALAREVGRRLEAVLS